MAEQSAVPRGVREASEWAWRGLAIVGAVVVVSFGLRALSEVVVPVVIAVMLAALLLPVQRRLSRVMAHGPAAGITLVGTILVVGGLLTLVGSQFSSGFSDLTSQVGQGLQQIRDWIRDTFNITDEQFTAWFESLKDRITSTKGLGSMAATAGLTATHLIAGLFISLFALFFFLYEGQRIWAWVVRLFPAAARDKVQSSGVIAWGQLSAFVRATILVAAVDAFGIGLGAVIIGVPFAAAIALLVFFGAFIPIVGALLSGGVAVLLALVAKGPIAALFMLGVVLAVQQIESHVLQPFLLGRAVAVHPLAVILAIATGVIVAGIVGALIAVPIAAVVNAVGHHLLDGDTEPPEGPLLDEEDLQTT